MELPGWATVICASPTVVNGIVYFGGYNAVLYALNARTGTLVWKYRTNSCGLYAAPIIVNGTLYQVTGCYGNVYAFDAATGAVKWQVKPPTASDTGWTPAVWNGNVYVGFTNGQMCALDQNTGATKWSYQAGGALYLGGAAVDNGLLFFGAGNGTFYALNATTGALVWTEGFRRGHSKTRCRLSTTAWCTLATVATGLRMR